MNAKITIVLSQDELCDLRILRAHLNNDPELNRRDETSRGRDIERQTRRDGECQLHLIERILDLAGGVR